MNTRPFLLMDDDLGSSLAFFFFLQLIIHLMYGVIEERSTVILPIRGQLRETLPERPEPVSGRQHVQGRQKHESPITQTATTIRVTASTTRQATATKRKGMNRTPEKGLSHYDLPINFTWSNDGSTHLRRRSCKPP